MSGTAMNTFERELLYHRGSIAFCEGVTMNGWMPVEWKQGWHDTQARVRAIKEKMAADGQDVGK
jgi:hypothetical protein